MPVDTKRKLTIIPSSKQVKNYSFHENIYRYIKNEKLRTVFVHLPKNENKEDQKAEENCHIIHRL